MTPQKAILLAGLAVMIGGGQILFKQASKGLACVPGWGGLVRLARDPAFIAALVLYGSATLLWVWAIRDVPLSRAYCFMGLVFIVVPILAWLVLHEPMNWKVLAGGAVIGAGILLTQM